MSNEPARGQSFRGQSSRGLARRGLMFVLSSPSGAGKTTLSRRLLDADPGIEMSVSVTTRAKRPNEVEGRDYHFVDEAGFARMIESDALLEHANVFGHRYGTPRAPVETALAAGRDVLFDIDWQGTQQLEKAARDDLVKVFILPPSVPVLESRLRSRAQDSAEVVAKRMAKAGDELSHYAEYDYVIVNTDIDRAQDELRAILAAERLKRHRRPGLVDFVRQLRGEL